MDRQPSKNIYESEWEEQDTPRGKWTFLDLSGDHLGLRIEKLESDDTSSIHHYHTLEEEHVIALDGDATLVLGSEEHSLKRGDHVWFKAGDEAGHHIVNRSLAPFTFLVIGERKRGDVCIYPDQGVATIKALNSGWKQFDIEQRAKTLQEES
jgi:uncharacterized cupin superfamily protein